MTTFCGSMARRPKQTTRTNKLTSQNQQESENPRVLLNMLKARLYRPYGRLVVAGTASLVVGRPGQRVSWAGRPSSIHVCPFMQQYEIYQKQYEMHCTSISCAFAQRKHYIYNVQLFVSAWLIWKIKGIYKHNSKGQTKLGRNTIFYLRKTKKIKTTKH
jgi:hypothetical protein